MARLFTRTGLSRRRRARDAALTVAQLGYAHWFFGNLYEAVVKIPDRLASREPDADGHRAGGLLSPGSPVRYHLPGVPVTLGATLAAVVSGWNTSSDRRWLAAAGVCTVSGYAATAYLVRTVILGVIFADEPVTEVERDRLLRRWHRLNGFRLVAASGAWLAAQKARGSDPAP